MTVEQKLWGQVESSNANLYTITNRAGASLVLTDFGAAVVQMNMHCPNGEIADVVLGHDTLQDYMDTPTYFGATVGRFANRIRRGKFILDGEEYQAACNEGLNSLHGGKSGYDKKLWKASVSNDENSVSFTLISKDGEEGFPGSLLVTSTYTLTDENVVRMDIRATTDKPTLCNIVHHSYFNLAGHDSGDVLGQELQIYSDFYTPVDDELIITGEVLKVADTPFDFREPRAIGERISAVPNAGAGRMPDGAFAGYDHNWCLKGEPGALRPVLNVCDPKTGRGFELATTEPGVHFYTGGYLDETVIGKGGKPYQQFAGYTFETQKFPDAPNLSHVPQARLNPFEEYHHVMEFRFFG
ncbi:aldose epimerase family protein [Ruegeria sp. HKCCD8929]|uniref:aldose epimerase family protein n=1 Tax=Ruegeria sp. HKCCD8929 TaxID=2683006 RepID=UPI001489CAED|nr:aldose epimerase family protein [Ruegeria sp. HKCCD8929]